MIRLALLLGSACVALVASAAAGPDAIGADAIGSAAIGADATGPDVIATLRVPEGFTVERVAAAPLVEHPVMAGFDDRGRLYVADNAGLNLPAAELEKQLPNCVRMLTDTDGDGRFDKSTVFADKMTFPQGAVWFRGALYVASPPAIWRLEDTDGDGLADRRQELVQKFGYIGNAADVHGCFITPSGRVAWCDGRHGHEFKDADGTTTSKGLAARVFSCRPDGSDLEVFCGGGMDNPVEVAFTPEGDTIGTMTFYNPDTVRHDALVHFVYGGVYPKQHPCTSEFKRTGELMPALSRFGQTAPSGLARYEGLAWGDEFRDNFFSAQFNTHKIVRHVLTRAGATYNCRDEDFLVSSSIDFHPTDVLVDADGSLLVIDTGGWFRIGCPASQTAKPEIGGAIYRIRRTAAAKIEDPRGLKIDWGKQSDTELADLLADPRPAVAERAVEWLVQRQDAAMGALATGLFESGDYRTRQRAIWALTRIGTENARLLLRQGLSDDDAPARQAAVRGVGDLRDAESLLALIDVLGKDEPAVRREAATALGRLRNPQAVPAILKALRQPADRFEEHALIFALIQINDPASTRKGLRDEHAAVRRGTLIALDQMDSGGLTRDEVAPLLATDDAALLLAVIDVVKRHPEWADALGATLSGWLAGRNPTDEQLALVRGALSALIGRPDVQELVAKSLVDEGTAQPLRLALLEAIAAADLTERPAGWPAAVRDCLTSRDSDVLRQAIATSAALGDKRLAEPLLQMGTDAARSLELRLAALVAAARLGTAVGESGFGLLGEQLSSDASLANRLAAAEALGRFQLTPQQRKTVAQLVPRANALEAGWLLEAFAKDTDRETGLALVAALAKSPATTGMATGRLRDVLKSYPGEVQSAAQSLFDKAAAADAETAARLNAVLSAAGDAARGEAVFFSQKAACSACHRVADRGERIGPELTKIGEIRSRRDLAEAILLPSASLARGFESYNIVTQDGRVHSGLVQRETAGAIYLRTTDRTEVRVPRAEIEQLVPSATSIMPQGLDKTLSPAELADLVAFLQSLK